MNALSRFLPLAGFLSLFPVANVLASEIFPVLRPENCQVDVKAPAGSNAQYYQSKDCKTVFVLPREIAPMKVSEFQASAHVNDTLCSRFFDRTERILAVEAQISTLEQEWISLIQKRNEKLETSSTAELESITRSFDPVIKLAAEQVEEQRKILEGLEMGLPFSELPGADLNIHLILNQARDVEAYQTANLGSGLRFEAAKIRSGVLSFDSAGSNGRILGRSVLEARFPKLSAKEGDEFQDGKNLILNGGASGTMTLSQPVVCQLVKRLSVDRFDVGVLTSDSLSTAGFAANYTYEVPVTANISFNFLGVSKAQDLRTAFQGSIKKSEFTQEDISRLIHDGALSNSIQVTYRDGGVIHTAKGDLIRQDPQLSPDEDETVFSLLFNHALDLYLEQVIEKMKATQLISESVKTTIDPVEGKEVFVPSVVRKCRWKTSWGRSKKKCKSYTHNDRIFYPGVSSANRSAVDNSLTQLSFGVDSEQTLTIKHTSGFSREYQE